MRLVTFAGEDGDQVGVLTDGQVHALTPGVTLLDLLRSGELHAAGELALAAPSTVRAFDEIRLRAPVPDPPTVRDFMVFEQHVEGAIRLAGANSTAAGPGTT